MSSGVIYTTITHGYDALKQPKIKQTLPMVCFTDELNQQQSAWQLKPIKVKDMDPTRTARYHKLHPNELFPEFDWSIWVDGSLSINADLNDLLNEVIEHNKLGVYRHAKRDCSYEAALNCIDKGKDNPEIIKDQMASYSSQNFPQHMGLVASGVLVRRHHDPEVVKLMNAWWQEIKNHSSRDQLSFNYVCWQLNFSYYVIPERIGDGKYFRRNPHRAG